MALLIFAFLYWLGADRIRESGIDAGVGSQALPKGLAYTLGLLAFLLIVQTLVRRGRTTAETPISSDEPKMPHNHIRAFGMVLIGAVYLAILNYSGYIIGLSFLMLATALYMGKKITLSLVVTVVLGAFAYWLLFVKVLKVPMPEGIWPHIGRTLGG
jgi:hypothetical protein